MNVIDFQKARARLWADVFDKNRDAELWVALSAGFEFKHVGEDRWGDLVFSIARDGILIVPGSAELSVADGLCLVRELVNHCLSPAQYQQHAARFIAVVAEAHAEADAAIEAEQ